jgi:rod shape-determining protein MreC
MVIFSRYTWWVGAMAGLAMLVTLMGQVGVLGPVQGMYLTLTGPLDRGLSSIFSPVAGVLSDIGDLQEIRDQNRALRLENEQLRNQLVQLEADKERIAQLEAALGIADARPDEQLVFANVVNRQATPFTETISIDRGSGDGMRVGMIVLSAQGTLIGSVTEVFRDRSFVRTIRDSRSRVASQVIETGVEGVVSGTANRELRLQLAQGAVTVGETVVTSALSGRFLPNIPIGKVTAVSGSPQDLSPTVTIDPSVRIADVSTVIVITSFLPEQTPAGATP